jgi:hypothetical protein
MMRKQWRDVVIVLGLAMIGLAWLASARLGGLVKAGSIRHKADAVTAFTVTDNAASLPLTYKGIDWLGLGIEWLAFCGPYLMFAALGGFGEEKRPAEGLRANG